MTTTFNSQADKFIRNMITATLPMITVVSGECRYNFRCQMNAVNDAVNSGDERIAMCFYIENDQPILHFVNVSKKGVYMDNTFGVWSQRVDFYLVRFIDKSSFWDVNKIFTAYRKELRRKLPLWIRILSNNSF